MIILLTSYYFNIQIITSYYSWKFTNFEQIEVLGLSLGKIVWREQILASCKLRFPFYNDFKILHAESNICKESWNFLNSRNNFNFLKTWGLILSKSSFIIRFWWFYFKKHLYLTIGWELKQNLRNLQMRVPSPPKHSRSLFIIRFWLHFVWNIYIWILVQN